MKADALFRSLHVTAAAEACRQAEEAGYDGVWTSEVQCDPFLPLAVAATGLTRISLGTAIATAFTRSPMVTAMISWELQRASRGRFSLGLGAQVKAHNERRFSVVADQPAARLREIVLALRHIWGAFQGDHALAFTGEFYSFDLLTPFFDPGPSEFGHVPILLAAVGPHMYRIAGEVADGVHVHPFHSVRYLREVAIPALDRGMQRAGRSRSNFTLAAPVFCVVGRGEERDQAMRLARQQIAVYASTPSYRGVLDTHGLGELQSPLAALARRGDFEGMTELVRPELVSAIAVEAESWHDAAHAIHERYDGILDRVSLYAPPNPPEGEELRRFLETLADR